MAGFEFQQRQTQAQVQVLSQRQIQALEMLSMGTQDLRGKIYEAVEKNPALEITKDTIESTQVSKNKKITSTDYTRVSSKTSAGALEASDNFQAALEAKADERQSLHEHLLQQLNMLKLSPQQKALGEKLICNLDPKGFHLSAPVSLLDHNDPLQTEELLEKTMELIQQMDPAGTCTKNTEESLYVQAKYKDNCNQQALFILDGHLNFLDPPQPAKVLKKIQNYFKEQSTLFGRSEKELAYSRLDFTEESIEEAIKFIRTLDPMPARNFGYDSTHYIAPDIYVEKLTITDDETQEADGIVKSGGSFYRLRLSSSFLPEIKINGEYKRLTEQLVTQNKNLSADEKKKMTDGIKDAQEFIESLNYRQSTILQACSQIVKAQKDFFEKGPGNLVPLRQSDIAQKLNVHETTISRMANSKYIQCEWGLFPVKYFFTNAVISANRKTVTSAEELQNTASKDKVLNEIKIILEAHKDDEKKLSDQKISDLLSEKGISVARRTVAKYRSILNIDSSYNR